MCRSWEKRNGRTLRQNTRGGERKKKRKKEGKKKPFFCALEIEIKRMEIY
jgi:hypothetical protein